MGSLGAVAGLPWEMPYVNVSLATWQGWVEQGWQRCTYASLTDELGERTEGRHIQQLNLFELQIVAWDIPSLSLQNSQGACWAVTSQALASQHPPEQPQQWH